MPHTISTRDQQPATHSPTQPDRTSPSASTELQTQQRKVQRLLGRCLLRLQQYERLIKTIVAYHEISGPVHALDSIRVAHIASADNKTLGTLVGALLGSYVTTDGTGDDSPHAWDASDHAASLGLRVRLSLSAEDYVQTQSDLKDLVLGIWE